jgi:hypothetical protein
MRVNTGKPYPDREVYPYLLRMLPIASIDYVQSNGITYIPLQGGMHFFVPIHSLISTLAH